MELKQITDKCYYFSSPSNIGYIRRGDTGLVIDAGIDASASKKVIKQLKINNWPLTHLFITHAHSDHYGGANEIQKRIPDVVTIAPEYEADVLRYPKWEPLYLFQGNEPPSEMRNKFLEGKQVHVDTQCHEDEYQWGEIKVTCIHLPGHADHQLGLIYDGVLFAADSYMAMDVVHKHGVPFLIDYGRLIESQEKLLTLMDLKGAVPSHGDYEENYKATIRENIQFYKRLLEEILVFLKKDELLPNGIDILVKEICDHYDIQLRNISMWNLYRTSVVAFLMEGVRQGDLILTVIDNAQVFKWAT